VDLIVFLQGKLKKTFISISNTSFVSSYHPGEQVHYIHQLTHSSNWPYDADYLNTLFKSKSIMNRVSFLHIKYTNNKTVGEVYLRIRSIFLKKQKLMAIYKIRTNHKSQKGSNKGYQIWNTMAKGIKETDYYWLCRGTF
jgi:hypothetical protein